MKKSVILFSMGVMLTLAFASCDVNREDYVGQWKGEARDSTKITMTLNEDGSFEEVLETFDQNQLTVTMTMKGQWSINGKDIEALVDPKSVEVVASAAEKSNDAEQLKIRIANELEKRFKQGTKAKFLSSTNIEADTLNGTFPTQGSVKLVRVKPEAEAEPSTNKAEV